MVATDPAGAFFHEADTHLRAGRLEHAHFALVQARHVDPSFTVAHWMSALVNAERRDERGASRALKATASAMSKALEQALPTRALRSLLLESMSASPWPAARRVATRDTLVRWAAEE